jgi:hypothetical protein
MVRSLAVIGESANRLSVTGARILLVLFYAGDDETVRFY